MTVDASFDLLRRRRGLVALLVAAWTALWLGIGVLAFVEVRDLETYSDTLVQSSQALETAGSALETIGAVPIIGDGPERLGGEVRATAREVRVSAGATRDSVRTLSIVIGVTIVLMPTVPVAAIFVTSRLARGRDVAAVRDAIRRHPGDEALERFLAHRAVRHLSLQTLLEVTPAPWRDLEEGRHRLLANAELTRLGLATEAAPGGRRQQP